MICGFTWMTWCPVEILAWLPSAEGWLVYVDFFAIRPNAKKLRTHLLIGGRNSLGEFDSRGRSRDQKWFQSFSRVRANRSMSKTFRPCSD
jgi:hypothetical protein